MRVAQTRTWTATAARRGFQPRWNSARADVPRQVQALVRLTFVRADPLVGIQQQDVDGHLEQLPQLIALGVSEQRVAFILQHKNRAARFDAAQRGMSELLKRSRHGHGMPVGRYRRRGSD
jgi:hypothetical protein